MDGKLVKWKEAMIHVLTHALHYGTAVFEGIRCYDTPKGPAIFRLPEHLERLYSSAKIYLMDIPYSTRELSDAVVETVHANGLKECYVRPLVYRGYHEMGVNPLPNPVRVAIAVWEWGSYLGAKAAKHGVRCAVSSWARIDPLTMPPQAKASANYANAALAKVEALKGGYDEAILLNRGGLVAEASGENIFRVKDGHLSTPPAAAGVLRGVTRDSVIHIADDLGIANSRVDISREELYTSDELFLSGTAAEITPVIEVDGRSIGNGKPGSVTTKIRQAYEKIVHGRNHKYTKWLQYVS